MPKSCLDGYLTDACASCSFWGDYNDPRGIGCNCTFPIMECDAFAKMCEEEQKSAKAEMIQPTSINVGTLFTLSRKFKKIGNIVNWIYLNNVRLDSFYEDGDDSIIKIDDVAVAYMPTLGRNAISLVTSLTSTDETPLNETDGKKITVKQFLSLFINAIGNMNIVIESINSGKKEYIKFKVEAGLVEAPNRIIREISFKAKNKSCTVYLKTY